MLLYYITDRKQLKSSQELLECVAQAAEMGVDYIQLRENDLSARELEKLAISAVKAVRTTNSGTKILINSRSDIAIAAVADGVHLRSVDVSPVDVRHIWEKANASKPLIAVSCHGVDEITNAEKNSADFAVFGPIFEKQRSSLPPVGLSELRRIRTKIPVLALGGISIENALACIESGAAGIAGIRLFQNGNMQETVRRLRQLG